MIVCVCKAVSERQVTEAIEQGCRSVQEVARCTGAGSGCGACRASIQQRLDGAPSRRAPALVMLPLVAVSS